MSIENKASIEIPSGVKVLTATPLDTKSRVQSLTDIVNNPSYYVGYFPIYCLDDSKHYKISGGDSTSGWMFEEGAGGGNSLPLEEVGNNKGVRYTAGSVSNIDWGVDDDSIPSIGMVKENTLAASDVSNFNNSITTGDLITTLINNSNYRFFCFDSNTTDYDSKTHYGVYADNYYIQNDVADSGTIQHSRYLQINNSTIKFYNGLGKGIEYKDVNSYANIDWATNDDHIPSIGMVKNNALPISETFSGMVSTGNQTLTVFDNNTPYAFFQQTTVFGDDVNAKKAYMTFDAQNALTLSHDTHDAIGDFVGRGSIAMGTGSYRFLNTYNNEGWKYGSASDYSAIDWTTNNDHIPPIGMIKANVVSLDGELTAPVTTLNGNLKELNLGYTDTFSYDDILSIFRVYSQEIYLYSRDGSGQVSSLLMSKSNGSFQLTVANGKGLEYSTVNDYSNINWDNDERSLPNINLVKKNAQKYNPLEIVSDGSTLTISTSNAFNAIHMDDNTSTVNTIEIGQDCLEIGQDIEIHVGGNSVGFEFVNLDSANVSIVGSLASGSTTAWDTVGLRRMSDGAFGQTGKQVYKTV